MSRKVAAIRGALGDVELRPLQFSLALQKGRLAHHTYLLLVLNNIFLHNSVVGRRPSRTRLWQIKAKRVLYIDRCEYTVFPISSFWRNWKYKLSIIGRGLGRADWLSVASRLIICRCRRQRQIIDLRATDKSRCFARTEFNDCFIIHLHIFILCYPRFFFK